MAFAAVHESVALAPEVREVGEAENDSVGAGFGAAAGVDAGVWVVAGVAGVEGVAGAAAGVGVEDVGALDGTAAVVPEEPAVVADICIGSVETLPAASTARTAYLWYAGLTTPTSAK